MADKVAQALAEKEAGNVFYKNKDFESAVAAYGRAIALDPESETAALCYSNRSAVFQTQKKFDNFVISYTRYLVLNKQNRNQSRFL